MKKTEKVLLGANLFVIAVIFILNYFYQLNGFDFTLKCICSGLFALLGLVNLIYAVKTRQAMRKFYIAMSLALILAFLGDYLIGYDFIVGATVFALGHVFFIVAYCFIGRIQRADYLFSLILFLGCLVFLVFCPWLVFDSELLRAVCIIYALIISAMLGKAIGNLIGERTAVTGAIALGSALFFFSDLMLVFDRFIGRFDWTDNACMGSYYPALCLLALSMCLKAVSRENKVKDR